MTKAEYEDAELIAGINGIRIPQFEELERGGIVGETEIVACVAESDSEWFFGKYGFVLSNSKTMTFSPCLGKLGFFKANVKVELPPNSGSESNSDAVGG